MSNLYLVTGGGAATESDRGLREEEARRVRALAHVHEAYDGLTEDEVTGRLMLELQSLPAGAKVSLTYTIQGYLQSSRGTGAVR